MKASLQQELIELLGREHVKTDYIERLLYSHDIVPIPGIMAMNYRIMPDAVVRPDSVEQISSLLTFAGKNSLPVVPRGKATTMLGGAVPVRGGVVLDLSSLNRIVRLDAEKKIVEVEAGVTWEVLLKILEKEGLTLYSYPSSAPSGTVGGWLANAGLGVGKAGLGIGSSRFGYAADQVEDLEVVLPSGEVLESVMASANFRPGDFLGTDGILGIIARAVLRVRPVPPVRKLLSFSFADMQNLCEVVNESASLRPFFVAFEDANLLKIKRQAGLHVPAAGHMVTYALEGDADEVECSEKCLQELASAHDGTDLGTEVAEEEWQGRYYPLKIKRIGPSIMGGEFSAPLSRLKTAVGLVESLAKKRGIILGLHGVLGANEALLMPQLLCDERRTLRFITLTSLVKDFNNLSLAIGGTPYGAGLFNAFYAREVHGAGFFRLAKLKKELDRRNIMNPGKGLLHMTRYGIPVPKLAYNAAMSGLGLLMRFVK